MTQYGRVYARITALVLMIGLAASSARAGTTYYYTGSPFTTCSYGACPANYTSDYLIASITFAAPLAPGLPYTNETAALTGWTLKDALGYFSYSSSNPNTASYLTGYPPLGVPPLALATDNSGNIVAYAMAAAPAQMLGITGASEAAIFAPPFTDPKTGQVGASLIDFNYGTSNEWDASESKPGVFATPETSSLVLTLSGVILILAAICHRRGRQAAS